LTPSLLLPSNSFAIKPPDPQYSGPSRSVVETDETSGKIAKDPDIHEPEGEGHMQMEYFSD
jgi:hypothetical protein